MCIQGTRWEPKTEPPSTGEQVTRGTSPPRTPPGNRPANSYAHSRALRLRGPPYSSARLRAGKGTGGDRIQKEPPRAGVLRVLTRMSTRRVRVWKLHYRRSLQVSFRTGVCRSPGRDGNELILHTLLTGPLGWYLSAERKDLAFCFIPSQIVTHT